MNRSCDETSSDRPLRWGILGLGRFGRIHAEVLQALPGVELVAICNRNPEKLAAAGSALQVSQVYTDYRELLAEQEIDCVTIATHWREHAELAIAALDAGKHVLLEKPMAASTTECHRVLAAAERAAGYLMVGHVCRFDPRVTLAKQAIDAGQIGRVVYLRARRNLPVAPGSIRLDKISPLMGDGIHDADLMMWFLGRAPSRVEGHHLRVDHFQYPDIGVAVLHFDDQALGVIETVWRLPPNVPTVIDAQLEVIGTAGKLVIDCAHTGLEILTADGLRQPDTVYWPRQHDVLVGALANEIQYFVRCVRTGTAPTVITPREAARAVRVMEQADQAAAAASRSP